jgi:hypothetical protein
MRGLIISLFLILFLSSCIKPTPPNVDDSKTEMTLKFRAVKVEETSWTDQKIDTRIKWMRVAFLPANLKIQQLPTETINRPEWITIDGQELNDIFIYCRTKNEVNKEEVVVLTDKLTLQDGLDYGGCANYCNNISPINRYGTIWAANSYETVGFHELAHRLTLHHSSPKVPCDTMSFPDAFPGYNGCQQIFSDMQISQMRKWMLSPEMSNCIQSNIIQVMKLDLIYDSSGIAE